MEYFFAPFGGVSLKIKTINSFVLSCLLTNPAIASAKRAIDDDAAKFGEQEAVFSAAPSADGMRIIFIGPGTGSATVAVFQPGP